MSSAAQARRARIGATGVVLLCLAIAGVEGYDIQAFGIAAPRLAPDLGLDPGQQGLAASAAMMGLTLGAVLGGWISDRVGRKPVLLASIALFGVFSIATAVSPAYGWLVLARLATGLGFGGALANLVAVASEVSRPERRAFTVTVMCGGMPAGGTVVSLAARLLGPAMDWRALFFAGGLAPLLLLPLAAVLLPETRPQAEEADGRDLLATVFGGGRAGATLLLWGALFLSQLVVHLNLNWLPTLVVAKGLGAETGFAAALAFNLLAVVGTLIVGGMIDRTGFRWPLTLGFGGLAAATAALALAATPAAAVVLAGTVGMLAVGAQFGLYALAPALYPAATRAAGVGAALAAARAGSIVGPLAAGWLRAGGYSASEVLATLSPLAVVAGMASFALGARVKTAAGAPFGGSGQGLRMGR